MYAYEFYEQGYKLRLIEIREIVISSKAMEYTEDPGCTTTSSWFFQKWSQSYRYVGSKPPPGWPVWTEMMKMICSGKIRPQLIVLKNHQPVSSLQQIMRIFMKSCTSNPRQPLAQVCLVSHVRTTISLPCIGKIFPRDMCWYPNKQW